MRFEEGRPRQSEPWVETSFGHLGVVVALEYTVRRAKGRVHAALRVDGINEVDGLHHISLSVLVGRILPCGRARNAPLKKPALHPQPGRHAVGARPGRLRAL